MANTNEKRSIPRKVWAVVIRNKDTGKLAAVVAHTSQKNAERAAAGFNRVTKAKNDISLEATAEYTDRENVFNGNY